MPFVYLCLSAAFAGAFIDREVESKGLDFIDREKAKRHGESQIIQSVQERKSLILN